MIDSNRYTLASWAGYPKEQWRLAISKFPAPSNRPPASFWRIQRENAIGWLVRYGVMAEERQGKVSIGDTIVDFSYIV